MKLCRFAVISAFTLAGSVKSFAANASDWRFCIASDFHSHIAYLTPPFESQASDSDLEARVASYLQKKKLPYEDVQCRLPADPTQLEAERGDAEAFVKALGFQLEELH